MDDRELISRVEALGGCYDPGSEFSALDQLQICEAVAESIPVRLLVPAGAKKEKEDEDIPFCYRNNRCMFMAVSSGGTSAIFSHKNKSSIGGREKIAQHLSKALEDQGALLFYRKLVGSRRLDLLKNCLEITLEADKAGIIKTTKGRYFTGVLKVKTATQERLKKYKNCHGLIKGEFNGVGVTGGLAKEEVIELFGPEVIRREH